MRLRPSWIGAAALAVLACTLPARDARTPAAALPALADAAGRPAHVLLVTIAGLAPERYLAGDAMPALAALAEQGVAAERVAPVPGAGAYPAHASLVTGASPAQHAIVADQLLGPRGVRRAQPSHASQLRSVTLWQRVAEGGGGVASFDWPTTTGAEISTLLPDVVPQREGEAWSALAAGAATPWVAERIAGAPADAERPGAARDALLVDLACAALAQAPRLLLLRLRGPEAALLAHGPAAPEASAAFGAVDAQLVRLLRCAEAAGLLAQTALVVAGDRALAPVHTAILPNVALQGAGLVTGQGSWKAYARSNGASAYVYADEARHALAARKRLEAFARETAAFRVVSAEVMIELGADPEAWFALQAEPGFAFDNAYAGPPLAPASVRAAAGALLPESEAATGFVAWGRGFRSRVRVPEMSQLDVAPTLATLLDVRLDTAAGRPQIGLLRLRADTP
jgi:hypothetical protein